MGHGGHFTRNGSNRPTNRRVCVTFSAHDHPFQCLATPSEPGYGRSEGTGSARWVGAARFGLMVAKGLFYEALILWGTGVTGTNRNRTDIAWTIFAVSGMGVSVCAQGWVHI